MTSPYVNPWRKISGKDGSVGSDKECSHKIVIGENKLICEYCGETFKY